MWLNPQNFNLFLIKDNKIIKSYLVSIAKNGMGELKNSYKTPRGWHCIRAKIGNDCPINSIFVGRRPTGEIYSEKIKYTNQDWILTRILWLSGLEVGKNRLGNCDTMQRYVYIHGTPDSEGIGTTNSHGCIRMKNKDIIDLFNLVQYKTKIFIGDDLEQGYKDFSNLISN